MIGVYEQIQRDVEDIIRYSQDYPFEVNASALMESWLNAKQCFIECFEGKLCVRSALPIKVELSEEQQARRFHDFIHTLDDNAILTKDLEDFLKSNKKGFFDNRVVEPFPARNIAKGAKLSRSFRRFMDNKDEVRWAQDVASHYIQENKIEGYLYLSVDPRDYLTISENNARWRSCHSLDGDYRAGNLSYMTDDVTIVAYLSDGKQEHLKCMPGDMTWNSKKWRMLIHLNENIIYYDKQYPYFSEDLLDGVYKLILEYLGQYNDPAGLGFKRVRNQLGKEEIMEYNYMFFNYTIFDVREMVDVSDYIGYCDLISSTSYAPIVSLNDTTAYQCLVDGNRSTSREEEIDNLRRLFSIKIGGPIPCVVCGEEVVKRDCSFLCPECIAVNDADEDFFITCDSCRHRIYDEDEIFWLNDRPYCKTCYNAILKEETTEEEE